MEYGNLSTFPRTVHPDAVNSHQLVLLYGAQHSRGGLEDVYFGIQSSPPRQLVTVHWLWPLKDSSQIQIARKLKNCISNVNDKG